MKKAFVSLLILCFYLFISLKNVIVVALPLNDEEEKLGSSSGVVVKKEERRAFSSSEYGEVRGVKVSDERNGTYHLQFITMEPNSLFLPVLLHADMLFYVHSGSGRLSWIGEDGYKDELNGHRDETIRLNLQKGDVYRLNYGSVFFIESNLEPERQKLRIYSIFTTSNDEVQQPSTGPYSSIRDMLLGFDEKILQAAFKVPEEVIEEIKSGTAQPLIVHGVPRSTKTFWEVEAQFIEGLMESRKYNMFDISNKKKKTRLFNILKGDRDVENCNGWSTSVTRKKLSALKGSDMGIFMVNLTKGSMMGPHWNPMATEIAIVVQGQGMVRVVCSTTANGKKCKNARFRVGEGDVFVVPRFHPMAQMSFNNDTFVFMGFSTASGKNHPQFLAGKSSVLQTLEREVLATAFNVTNTTIDQLLAPQSESVILECTSCAEEEERMMEEEIEKEREEARKKEEEETRKREEEKRREEEEARKREEEEARKREEEEEEARRKEEEKRKQEEEEARKREEEEARKREEEEEQEEEEARRKEEEEEEARRKQEEEEARQREEEEARRQEEEKRKREEEEEEAARKREEEEAEARREQEEEEAKRQEEEERRREEAAARREEEGGEGEEGEKMEDRTKKRLSNKNKQEGGKEQGGAGRGEGQYNTKKIEEQAMKRRREFIKMW